MAMNTTRLIYPISVTSAPFISFYKHYFRVKGHFEKSALDNTKWPWTLQSQRYPICAPLVFSSPKIPVPSTTSCFRVTDYLQKSAPNDPNMTLNTVSQSYPIYILPPRVQNSSLFCCIFNHFWVTGHLIGDEWTEWPKCHLKYWTLDDL